ncbi:MAG: hypothetical protein QOH06_1340 [Acidobacteriota bacterium]|jgi:hypothetical protein|nr:hypothetical protein [Acidobacteriota bacterium]
MNAWKAVPLVSKSLRKTVISALVLASLCSCAPGSWKPGTYEDLVIGRSRSADVLRVLGKPMWTGHPEDEYDNPVESLLSYEYKNPAGFDGRITAVMKASSGKLIEVYVNPTDSIPLSTILERYGTDYVERDSELGPCPTAEELRTYEPSREPGYPYPRFLVYPQKGMYVSLSSPSWAQYIVFTLRCP